MTDFFLVGGVIVRFDTTPVPYVDIQYGYCNGKPLRHRLILESPAAVYDFVVFLHGLLVEVSQNNID